MTEGDVLYIYICTGLSTDIYIILSRSLDNNATVRSTIIMYILWYIHASIQRWYPKYVTLGAFFDPPKEKIRSHPYHVIKRPLSRVNQEVDDNVSGW